MKKITIAFAILIALSFLVFSCITHEENTNESSKSTLQKKSDKVSARFQSNQSFANSGGKFKFKFNTDTNFMWFAEC